ncbi:hypothetical protein Taro_022334 [Colocasia esculenta]|uniref:Myb/SANT-like domain-containing protein n=1 Tax=Colocasia esculenta TaxID=4460 RepID=A0A843V835_COLES|nr:hypothetical protein [Colocasia esculenta]
MSVQRRRGTVVLYSTAMGARQEESSRVLSARLDGRQRGMGRRNAETGGNRDMDRSHSMTDREERLRMSNEGGDGPSQIPIMGGQDRDRLSKYQFLHQGPMDNWQPHAANRGQSLLKYNRFHPSLGAGVVDSQYRSETQFNVFNTPSPIEILDDIGTDRVKDNGQSKGRTCKGFGQSVKAVWDERKHAIFVRICLEQKIAGNKPSNTLNKLGHDNLEREFFKESGTHYIRSQLKNHWDSTRRDWQIWKALGKQTGIGWDEVKKTYSQTTEWWENFGKTWPGAKKFATIPLAHERDLDSLFLEGAALGEDTYIPSFGVIPPDLDIDEDIAANIDDEPISFDGSCGTESPIERGGKEGSQEQSANRKINTPEVGGTSSRNIKRSKLSTGDKIELAMREVCDVLKVRNMVATNTRSKEDPFSIEVVLDMLEDIPGMERDTPEWLSVVGLMRDVDNRRLFVALKTAKSRGFVASE